MSIHRSLHLPQKSEHRTCFSAAASVPHRQTGGCCNTRSRSQNLSSTIGKNAGISEIKCQITVTVELFHIPIKKAAPQFNWVCWLITMHSWMNSRQSQILTTTYISQEALSKLTGVWCPLDDMLMQISQEVLRELVDGFQVAEYGSETLLGEHLRPASGTH